MLTQATSQLQLRIVLANIEEVPIVDPFIDVILPFFSHRHCENEARKALLIVDVGIDNRQ